MNILHPAPQILEINDSELLERISKGIILFSSEMGYPNGIRLLAVSYPLPDGNFSIKCHVFDTSDEPDEYGTTWSEIKPLGFLTQEAISRLSPHVHEGCLSSLEIRTNN